MSSVGGAINTTVGRVSATILAIAAVGSAAVLLPTITGSGGGGAETANLWVDTTTSGNTCTRASSASAYSSNNACNTLDAAYQAATQGDLVIVKSGTYTAQTVADDASKHTGTCDVGATSTCVTIREAAGETATLADLTTRAWNVYFDGFNFTRTGADGDGGPSAKGGKYVVYANMRATVFYIAQEAATAQKPDHIHIYGGEYGPLTTCPGGGMKIGSEEDDDPTNIAQMPSNITVEGTYIHDFQITSGCPQNHMDCLHTRALSGYFRFLRNRVNGCEDYALLMDGNTSSITDDILVENNMVGPNIAGTESLALHGGAPGDVFGGSVIFRNNSADGSITPATNSTFNGGATLKMVNNYAPTVSSCRTGDGWVYSHNVTSSGPTCGTGDAIGAISVVNRAGADFTLNGGSAAIDAGDTGDCATLDFSGATRTGTCDAGAAQR